MKTIVMQNQDLNDDNNPINAVTRQGITTSKYKFQSSQYLIDALAKKGFKLDRVSTGNPSIPENRGFQKHLMVFNSDSPYRHNIGEENQLQILVQNSHDGNCAVKFYVGVFRAVCANGLICGDIKNYIKVNHKGQDFEKKIDIAIDKTIKQFAGTRYMIELFQETEDKNGTIGHQLAQFVVTNLMIGKKWFDAETSFLINNRRRGNDYGKDIYTAFNVVQENMMLGGMPYTIVGNKTGDDGKFPLTRQKTRGIKAGSDRAVKMNKLLWQELLRLAA